MSATLMVTDHAEFYRVNPGEGETVYYPANGPTSRDAARKADAGGDPPIVGGFAVYDTAVSTEYAVALHATKAEAEAHTPAAPIEAPADVFSDNGGQSEPNETEPASTTPNGEDGTKAKKAKKAKSRFKR